MLVRSRRALAVPVLLWFLAVPLTGSAFAQTPAMGCMDAASDNKCEQWTSSFDDPTHEAPSSESATAVQLSRDGSRVYTAVTTSTVIDNESRPQWAVLAQDAADGTSLWSARWGEYGRYSFPTSVAVSPDGSLVYVSGSTRADFVAADSQLVTIAFDSDSGDIVWEAVFDGNPNGLDNARDIVATRDGSSLLVAAISTGTAGGDLDYVALSYDARTGEQRWATRWTGLGTAGSDSPFALAVDRRSTTMFLTGHSAGSGEFNVDFGTIAVSLRGPGAGQVLWEARHDSAGHGPDRANAIALSPDGRTVFVTGMTYQGEGGPPFPVNYALATVSYDAATGEQRWLSEKQWEPDFNEGLSVDVDPSGRSVVVTGQIGTRTLDFGTVAYSTASGEELWADRYGYSDYELELGRHVTMDPDGQTVYVTGISSKSPPRVQNIVLVASDADLLTIAYDVSTGTKQWLARYNPTETAFVSSRDVAISLDGSRLVTAATIDDQNWDSDGDDNDAGLIAYDLGAPSAPPQGEPTSLAFTGPNSGQYSDETTVAARLLDADGDPIPGAEVAFDFQEASATVFTDDDGVASYTTTLTSAPGSYPVTATFAGESEFYAASSGASSFAIEREDSAVTVHEVATSKKDRQLWATLTESDEGRGLAGMTIDFYADTDWLGSATTDDTGVARFTLAARYRASRWTFGASFAGDGYYLASNT